MTERTNRQRQHDLRRALAKRGPSENGWRWNQRPTPLQLAAWRHFKATT